MASDNKDTQKSVDKGSSTKSDRVIGEGMTSLDSTQAPLKAETGLPDYDAMTNKGKPASSKGTDAKDSTGERR